MLDISSAKGILEALLAAVAITWSLQLQFVWRAFDTVRRTTVLGLAILGLLMLGTAALLLPLVALTYAAFHPADGIFVGLFWWSLGLAGGFILGLLVLYVLLVLVFTVRGHTE